MAQLTYYDKKQILPLDGLRGIAILLVVCFHNFKCLGVTTFGWTGVDLFFVLSGFLITRILFESKAKPHYFKNFIIRRALRIFPVYYLVLFTCLLLYLVSHSDLLGVIFNYRYYFIFYAQNILFTINGEFIPNTFLNHFWSLSVEEHFYLFWPLLVFLLPEKKLLGVSVVLIICSRLLSFYMMSGNDQWVPVYVFTLCRMDSLISGALIATLLRTNLTMIERSMKPLLILGTVGLLTMFGYALFVVKGVSNSWNPRYMILHTHALVFSVNIVFFSALLLYSLTKNRFSDMLQHPALVFCGKYSYGIYVYHLILFKLSDTFLTSQLSVVLSKPFLVSITTGAISTLVTIVVAVLSYELFEKKFIALKSKFS